MKKKMPKPNSSTTSFLVAIMVLAFASCASSSSIHAPSVPARVYPQAPALARLEYVQSIRVPADMDLKPSAWSRMNSWITGRGGPAPVLAKPFGLCLDESSNLCVTDMESASVCFFDLTHGAFHQWNKIGAMVLQSPVAVAKRKDVFYVADSKLGLVLAFNSTGHLLCSISNQLVRPAGLAVASDRLYVADSQLHHVAVFDLSGHYLFQFGRRGIAPGEFNFPTHIALAPGGQILVTDSMNRRIEAFDSNGAFQSVIGGAGESSGHFTRPKGVASDSYGHIYVADALFDNFQIFDSAGQFLLDVGSTGAEPGEFCLPAGVVISPDNRIFVADSYNHRVQVFKYIGPP